MPPSSCNDGLLTPPPQLLRYLPAHRVLICLRCRYAIQPGAVSRHLKDIHLFQHAQRQPFLGYASQFDLAQPNEVSFPDDAQFPVPFLPVQNGLACRFDGCRHLCATTKRMKQHWTSVHGSAAREGLDWCPVPIQTFFRGNALQYFTAPALLSSSPSPSSASSFPPSSVSSDSFANSVDTRWFSVSAPSPDGSESTVEGILAWDNHLALTIIHAHLLDHYLTSTYHTLSCNPDTDRAFREVVPQLAAEFPFLLHGVLACSALHLAHCDPKSRSQYVVQAMRHQAHALPSFRWTILHVDSENGHAVLAFAFFLVVCSLSLDHDDERLFLTTDGSESRPSIHWIHFLRNGCSMLCPIWPELISGPLAPLADLWRDDLDVSPLPTDPLLVTLLSAVPSGHGDPMHCWSDLEIEIYNDSAAKLADAFAFAERHGYAITIWDVLNAWAMRVTPEYLRLLQRNHIGALLLLAYYSLLLRPLQTNWFLHHRINKLLDEISIRLEGRCPIHIWDLFLRVRGDTCDQPL